MEGQAWRIRSLKIVFAKLNESLARIESLRPKTKIAPDLIEKVKRARLELRLFFDRPQFSKICSDCYKDCSDSHNVKLDSSSCCSGDYGTCILPQELIYFAAIGYNLPEPDWEFLEREGFWGVPFCIFCSSGGCLLKENRRLICLEYICSKLHKALKKEGQYPRFVELRQNLKTAIINFSFSALESLGACLDESTRSLIEYFLSIKRVG